MTLVELQASITELTDLQEKAKPNQIDQVERLLYDLKKYYKERYDDLPKVCRNAFDELVTRRIAAFPALQHADTPLLGKFVSNWKSRAKSASLKVYFGQMRVGPNFQESENDDQKQTVGFPAAIIGRAINAVQGDIHGGQVSADQITVCIFWAEKLQKWICANNRGYTTHCKASKWPSRMIPRVADTAELNRLDEKMTVGRGGFTYADGYTGTRLNGTERTLPSVEMPITTGPNTWIIEDVVSVPLAWR